MTDAEQRYPPGWDAERVREVIEYYDSLTEDEWIAEDEAAFALEGHTVMVIPHHLVPAVRDLLAESELAEPASEATESETVTA